MKTKILIVDDSLTVRMELKEVLEDFDVTCTCAASGEEAIDFLGAQGVDLILLDLSMPGLSGLETCQLINLHPIWRDIPVIILTAQSGKETLVDCIRAGAANYIVKDENFKLIKAYVFDLMTNVRGHSRL